MPININIFGSKLLLFSEAIFIIAGKGVGVLISALILLSPKTPALVATN